MSQPSSTEIVGELESLRVEIWNRALHAFGTAYIFEDRARRFKRRLKWLNFVALAVPLLVGGLALSYGIGLPFLGLIVTAGATVGLVQLAFSAWSVSSGWVESYGYAVTSLADNQRLAQDLKELASNRSLDIDSLRNRYEVLKALDNARSAQDSGQNIEDQEKRMGMRASLRERRLSCAGCEMVPTSMNPSDCDVCGNFKLRKF
ncbi:mobilome CxxCx(11)CxxC protein [Micromonospora zamorensis]|uniref:mobilome CxxCx(11)CxxC protein n=1 Tax=Micromonospora zamorensis TaxID=709883 RepID=UPI00399D6D87